MQESSLFSTPSPAFVVCRFSDDVHSNWCEVIPHCSFFFFLRVFFTFTYFFFQSKLWWGSWVHTIKSFEEKAKRNANVFSLVTQGIHISQIISGAASLSCEFQRPWEWPRWLHEDPMVLLKASTAYYPLSSHFFPLSPLDYKTKAIFFFFDHNKSNNDCNYQTWNTLILCHNIDIQSSNPPL